jgi:hypothetical protein
MRAPRAAGQNQNCISARLHSRSGDKRQCTPLKRAAPCRRATAAKGSVAVVPAGSGHAAGRTAGAAASNGGGVGGGVNRLSANASSPCYLCVAAALAVSEALT